MTTTGSNRKPLRRNLEQLHTFADIIEKMFRRAIEATAAEGREAEAADIDFTTFIESWTAMLPAAQELADEAGIDLAVFASSWADLLFTIRARMVSNEELRKAMEVSIANKVGNAELLERNIEWLAEVTPDWIANYISMWRSQGIVEDAIAEAASRGEPATTRLKWLSEALKKNGY